ncbi:hypothetical protein [Paracidovorax valerianellae]|uniref:Uncharacterized protein n=1 Tax=Paracidovorax valerianellae TaxID=187868 RepID=A0A1G6WQM1_9BURK|nr:hypothetical protein [Paracidovorax valerianellae]MDA8447607.1 hypothetical protein [Paracidovorax valerianellae]SDD67527.1 hypothetical protein SAMN05192589_10867 [Paracidovorax valerianellae]
MTLTDAALSSRPRWARQFLVLLAGSALALALAGCGGSGGGGASTDAPGAPGAEKPQLRCAP